MNVQQQNPDGSWSPANPMGLICEQVGCGKPAVGDFNRIPTGDEWDSEPEALCENHSDGRESVLQPTTNLPDIDQVVSRSKVSAWVKWFDTQSAADKRTIALAAIERLMDEGKVAFWADDVVDKFGNTIAEDEVAEEHLFWNDEHKEDLRIPF